MADFPTLSKNPVVEGWEEQAKFDPTVRNEMEGGAEDSYSTTTVVPWTWRLTYRDMTNADKLLMVAFEKTTVQFGKTSFNWTNPQDSTVYVVKLGEKLKYKLENTLQHLWAWTVYLIEANPTSD